MPLFRVAGEFDDPLGLLTLLLRSEGLSTYCDEFIQRAIFGLDDLFGLYSPGFFFFELVHPSFAVALGLELICDYRTNQITGGNLIEGILRIADGSEKNRGCHQTLKLSMHSGHGSSWSP